MLFDGSAIPAPQNPDERLSALIAEHIALRNLFMDIERDKEKKIDNTTTRAVCAACCAIPDIHNEDTVAVWGGDAVLEGTCAVMLAGVRVLISDKAIRFGDNSIWPRLLDAVERMEPAVINEDPFLSPV